MSGNRSCVVWDLVREAWHLDKYVNKVSDEQLNYVLSHLFFSRFSKIIQQQQQKANKFQRN